MKKTFKKADLQELLCGDELETESGHLKIIVNEYTGSRRWSKDYDLVFSVATPGTLDFYKTYYSVGATENQDESPFEYDEDDIECEQVYPKTKIITVYE